MPTGGEESAAEAQPVNPPPLGSACEIRLSLLRLRQIELKTGPASLADLHPVVASKLLKIARGPKKMIGAASEPKFSGDIGKLVFATPLTPNG